MTPTINGRKELLARHCLSEDDFKQTGLQWDALDKIRVIHEAETQDLLDSAAYVYKRLLTVPDVHSLKLRVKDPEHLVAKIIRKKIEHPELDITPDNYRDYVTDLIGIRALHLFKEQWQPIHDFVMVTWGRELLHESPRAYIRRGDAGPVIEAQRAAGCEVEEHPFGYRSVHYLIKSQPAKVTRITELQVRTVFEEGWSEIDHQVRYPLVSDDPLLGELTVVFNRLAGSADEMGSFIKILSLHLREQSVHQVEHRQQLALAEEKITNLIHQSKASDKEKEELRSEVAKLRQQQVTYSIGALADYSTGFASLGNFSSTLAEAGKISSAMLEAGKIGSSIFATSDVLSPKRTCSRCGQPFRDILSVSTITLGGPVCPSCRTPTPQK